MFQPVTVTTRTFAFSPQERLLYQRFSALVREGRVFGGPVAGGADGAGGRSGSSWLLYVLQKIATSSVAALVAALGARKRGVLRESDYQAALAELEAERTWEPSDPEREALLLTGLAGGAAPQSEELASVEQLLSLASEITVESRLREVLAIAQSLPERETLLLFTEYKATQALIVSGLAAVFGANTVAFINGDGRLDNVAHGVGPYRTLEMDRVSTAYRFNRGAVRFLVSTEAAAEGIDLHENCCRLVHIDLPWNPMRVHQRVGRLDRIGQTRPIQVTVLRNVDSLEETILSVFYRRIDEIQRAHSAIMEHPDDVLEMVLGTLGDPLTILGSAAFAAQREGWDQRRAEQWGRTLLPDGLQTAVGQVQDAAMQAAHYDPLAIPSVAATVPLSALVPFLTKCADEAGATDCIVDNSRVSLTTPPGWCDRSFAHFTLLRPTYHSLQFDRTPPQFDSPRVLFGGPGNRLFDAALAWADRLPGQFAVLPGLKRTLVIFACLPMNPHARAVVRRVVVSAEVHPGGEWRTLSDVATLMCINEAWQHGPGTVATGAVPTLFPDLEAAQLVVRRDARRHGVPFDMIQIHALVVLFHQASTQ